MNVRDDEAWLDTLLQRQLPSGPSDDGFREQLLERLPPPERPKRRAFGLGLTWLVAALSLLLPSGEGHLVFSSDTGSLLVPCCLGTALIWYVVDRLT
ncbi:hypothetical protein ATI61_110322 [Archangium gephyra]|uniref:DUF3040 domain-containing protein n=1 Tax=Archangium gephyra TaxID=48 RepID=A0AAC8QDV7_9BACT|nr:hypothetical protein [Archangium gephyra]AKJ05932.1 Hypothetical protein AA314_07558 [Archangium gephyra]REG27315.1 hypothetical protein ATI61_110322 [Archangium gephyra]